ncbi:MAG: FKBP-type peptidyl-prolyl cis-trans isomerase [Planctomycetota bacterium]
MAWKIGISLCFLGVAILASGCRSTAERNSVLGSELTNTGFPVSDEPPAPWEKLTFIHKPEFQEGAGPMDGGEVPEFSATDSGLRYRILRDSAGKKPTAENTVTVNYRGWLNSGKIFDSSYERGEPTTFRLGSVIPGWTEGMQLVGEGGMIELWIPSRLGYGEQGSPGSIPPHSHLHFIVELIRVD